MKKRILFVAGRELSYSRTHIVYHALLDQGYEVVGCFPPDRSFKHYPRLIARAIRLARECDLVLVGFYGQIILPFIRLCTRKPMLFDMYITTLDTMVYDRGKARPGSLMARLYGLSDRLSYRLADLTVLETRAHIDWFCSIFGVTAERMQRIFLAVDESKIFPRAAQGKEEGRFLVHFHGEYAPFHGIQYILRAAHLLRAERDIVFQIVGKGITWAADQALARELGLENVRFYDTVPYAELANMMARADLCLGIFGDNDRVLRVTTNKVVESIAMARPLITARNAPVQELLTHGESAWLIERANPRALADAILQLKADTPLRERLAAGGHRVFQEHCTMPRLGSGFAAIIEEMTEHEG
ncbi:MAG TPA: glycosyltransferase [bacterium]|nr:glycosyltransferase [bacterium]